MSQISKELADRIQRRIDEIEAGESLGDWPMRVCKNELKALPLLGNRIYLWMLRPDGAVLCMDHEALNHPTEPETDPLALYAVFLETARRYPELAALVPARPAGATPCSPCQSSGMVRDDRGGYESCLGCHGLGWYQNVP